MLNREGILHSYINGGYHYHSQVLCDDNLFSVRCKEAGIYENKVFVGEEVCKQLTAPEDGTLFFQHKAPLIYADTAAVKLVI